MAGRYQTGYQYETSPRKLRPDYDTEEYWKEKKKKVSTKKKKTNNQKKKNEKAKTKTKTKLKLKSNVKTMLYIGIGFLTLLTISYRYCLVTENFNKKEALKSELQVLQKENAQLSISIEQSMNINNIEQLAKEKLGMQKPDNNQKVYVSLPKKDYIEPAAEEVITEENEGWFSKLFKTIFGE